MRERERSFPPAVEMKDVTLFYGNRAILRDFNLEVHLGERVLLKGPSGSGKSTVLHCLLGLAVPREGVIRVRGEPVDSRSVWKTRLYLGYVPQEPDLGRGTVRQVLEGPFAFRANEKLRKNLEWIPSLLRRFDLAQELLEKQASTLSGGEKQRVALIGAILLERSVVLLDEASSALDEENKRRVAEYFRETPDLTILAVSHDAAWENFATRTVSLAPAFREESA
ncbi:MAG TPA: ABC transporter ATP-binding protein [Synergistaceae bacterium]|nr:ABC transporter ATP-binding protein [Synergistaceae bacterium]